MKIRFVFLAECICLLALLAFPLGVALAGSIAAVSSAAFVAAVPPLLLVEWAHAFGRANSRRFALAFGDRQPAGRDR